MTGTVNNNIITIRQSDSFSINFELREKYVDVLKKRREARAEIKKLEKK